MKETRKASPHAASVFRSGGGEMGARVRAFNWAATPLGAIDNWPAALRITVDQMLASKFPACLFWGPDLIAVYNDGYRELLGKKPEALGEPMRVTWAEVWADIEPIAEKALAGESTFIENFLIAPDRDGSQQDAWFTFNYGPVFDENGLVVGMLDTVMETTEQVLARRHEREERDRHLNLLQQMPGFVAVLAGPSHVYDYVNDAYKQIAAHRPLLGLPVREAFPELDGQGFYELLDRVYASGQPYQAAAVPVRFKDGIDRLIDLLYTPIRDAAGVVQGIFVGGYDVTDRLKAESELRKLNAELEQRVIERTLAVGRSWQVSPDLLCVLDAEGNVTAANPAFEKTLGWTETELKRGGISSFVHPADLASTHAVWSDMVDRGLPVLHFENRWLTRGGELRWVSWVGIPEDNMMYWIGRDIQEEKDAAAMLEERTAERDVLAGIVENTNTFIQVLDLDFNFLALNTANVDEYERIYGHRPKVGDNLLAMLADRPERASAEALWRRAMSGESFTVQGEFGDAARSRRHYEMKFEVLRGEGGKQVAAFMSGTDITERLNEHRALLDTQEALRHAQKMEAVGQLTGGIAHDFNNLLAGIGGSLQVMQKRLKSGKLDGLERYLDMSESSVRRAAALTHRLLAFSRRQTLDPKPVDVNRLTSGMAELIRRTVGPGVELEVHSADDLWPTQVDPSQLENALLNLCINARDAMLPGGGCLTITCGNRSFNDREAAACELPAGDYVCLAVTDTGAGMSPEVITRIFDPFYTTKPMGQGTGLGLSMVYGFVRQSGGRVEADSRVGYGTTMRIFLPRFSGETSEEARIAAAEAAGAGQGETVLLIEDEEIVRDVIREVLTEAGYRVLVAGDGPTGLHILQADGRIDLLLTDVGLPGGMNGRQVADAGRVVRPGLKVLFITGYAENAAVGNGVMEHGMQVMTKPFEIEELSQKVRDMLDGG